MPPKEVASAGEYRYCCLHQHVGSYMSAANNLNDRSNMQIGASLHAHTTTPWRWNPRATWSQVLPSTMSRVVYILHPDCDNYHDIEATEYFRSSCYFALYALYVYIIVYLYTLTLKNPQTPACVRSQRTAICMYCDLYTWTLTTSQILQSTWFVLYTFCIPVVTVIKTL